jgi:hypothetical protein
MIQPRSQQEGIGAERRTYPQLHLPIRQLALNTDKADCNRFDHYYYAHSRSTYVYLLFLLAVRKFREEVNSYSIYGCETNMHRPPFGL